MTLILLKTNVASSKVLVTLLYTGQINLVQEGKHLKDVGGCTCFELKNQIIQRSLCQMNLT